MSLTLRSWTSALVAVCALFAAAAHGSSCSPRPLNILLTNDDGFATPGIVAVHEALVDAGHAVRRIAPRGNHSGGSTTLLGPAAAETSVAGLPAAPAYPASARGTTVDNYHGTAVADPYRWMESLDAPEVAEWVRAQNAVARPWLDALPLREHFGARLTALWDYPRTGLPVLEAGQLFYARNAGLERQAPLYRRDPTTGTVSLILDPNAISADGGVSLASWRVAPDGRYLAYGLATGGADWRTLKVRDLATGQDLPDAVEWVRFSGLAWTRDGKGFFYSRYPQPPKNKALEAALQNHAVWYHRVGTPQSQDTLIYARPDLPGWVIGADVTEDGRYLLVTLAEGAGNRNRLYFADLVDPMTPTVQAPVRPLVESDDAEYMPIGNVGSTLFLRTDKDAPNRKVVAIDLDDPAVRKLRPVIGESESAMESVALIGGELVAQYLVDVQSELHRYALDGTSQGVIELPGTGTVSGLSGRADQGGIWFVFNAPLSPATVYRHDPASGVSTPFDAPAVAFDAARYQTTALFARSKDGTRVPYFLTARKDLVRDGSRATLLYGYGGFSVSTLPTWRTDVLAWLELGGTWVTASLRGGAEYGEAWHEAGMLERKQNVFDDFIAVAEDLVETRVTRPEHLAIMGGSNGGLLVAAVMNQRPELFAAALPAVGVLDMLRFDRFTGGRLWVSEYGTATRPDQFAFLRAYSPLHNLRSGICYPATLVTTADHDDRVVPSHSFKYTAALQAVQDCARPVLIRVETAGSHGYRPTDRLIAERADQLAFAAAATGLRQSEEDTP